MKSFKAHSNNKVDEKYGTALAGSVIGLYLTGKALSLYKKYKSKKDYSNWVDSMPDWKQWIYSLDDNTIVSSFWYLYSEAEAADVKDDKLWEVRYKLEDTISAIENRLEKITDPSKLEAAKAKGTKQVEDLIKKSGVLG